ncbi:hypothetical protein IWW36_004425 [Coemansia brasiliensis]|uniref:Alpha/beta hydrolase fold-3 domain-containing protein n=1 Tax=Coemansia brasiliensis TaxID=2650707 RepID=A0A9W8I8B9_9FUNG|nr:hypothetical protein IWW36_004425 [Coemansia brasiliensis]
MLQHPLLSPLFADPRQFPPVQIHVGESDVLADDAADYAAQAHACSPKSAELLTYPGMNHYTILRGKTQLDKMYSSMRRFIAGK